MEKYSVIELECDCGHKFERMKFRKRPATFVCPECNAKVRETDGNMDEEVGLRADNLQQR